MNFEFANASDQEGIQALIKATQMGGAIQLRHEKQPDFFKAQTVIGDPHHTLLCKNESGEIVGMGSRGIQSFFYQGQRVNVGYLNQLRRSETIQNRIRVIKQSYQQLLATSQTNELDFDFTSIASDNQIAVKFFEKNINGLPIYQPMGKYILLTFNVNRSYRHLKNVGRIQHKDEMTELADFLNKSNQHYDFVWSANAKEFLTPQKHPNLNLSDWHIIREKGKIIGCGSLWDKRPFEQIIVAGYEKTLQRSRPIINGFNRLLGRPLLPREGAIIPICFASYLSTIQNRSDLTIQILQSILKEAQKRGIHFVNLGLQEEHPLIEPLQKTFRPRTLPYNIYAVSYHQAVLAKLKKLKFHLEASLL